MGTTISVPGRQGGVAEQLVGRDAELRELVERLSRARDGEGRTLLIEGAAGIGKTSLLDTVCGLARRGGFTVLRARGSELEQPFSFGVVRQLLGRTVHAADGEALFSGAAALARTAIEPSPSSAPAPGYPMLHGLYWLVANLADREPLVLAVDDLQWSDVESLEVVRFLAARLDGVRVLLLLTARQGGGAEPSSAVTALAQDGSARTLSLAPLASEASFLLLASTLGSSLGSVLAEACRHATGGNPFLLRALAEELRAGEGAGSDPAAVRDMAPRAIVRAVLSRLDPLPPSARALAQAAAVLGDGVELRRAATLAGMHDEDRGTLADALAAAGLLAPGRPLRFAHPLLRSAVEGTLRPAELAAAHRRAAQLLDAEAAGPEEVAAHLLASEPENDGWTLTTLRQASRLALRRAAPASAVTYLRRALREDCHHEQRAELLLELGLAGTNAGEPDALDFLRQAEALAQDPELRLRVACVVAPALGSAGYNAEAADVLRRASGLGDTVADALRDVRLVIPLALTEGRTPLIDEARRVVEVARGLRERAPRLVLAAAAHELAVSGGTAAEADELADLAMADGDLGSEYGGDSPFVLFAIFPYYFTGRFAAAERLTDEAIADARSLGAAACAGQLLHARAAMRMHQGDLARAEADAQSGLQLTSGQRRTFFAPVGVGALVDTALARGQIEEAVRAAGLLSADHREPGSILFQVWRLACAELCLARERPGAALGYLAAIARWEREWGAGNGVWCAWRPRAARAHAARGDHDRADELSALAVADARRFGAPHAMGVALEARAEVVEAERVTLLEEAVEWLHGDDSRLLYARVLTALGAARRATEEMASARATLDQAVALAQALGATGIERRARAELIAAGGRPRRARRTGPEALTPTERETVELAVQGLKNRQIAQAQFVTAKTVETHLSSAYRKLGIRSRAQLADVLSGAGA